MSRLAKKPLNIPEGVSLDYAGNKVLVKGPKGELEVKIPQGIELNIEGREVYVKSLSDTSQNRANIGTIWALLRNSFEGVTVGFTKILEIEGVGYRAVMEGEELVLFLGYVNPVRFKVPAGVKVAVEKNTIIVSGINKEVVGLVAAKIRSFKKPEPYKGKGIRYKGEVIKRKVGKKAVTSAG